MFKSEDVAQEFRIILRSLKGKRSSSLIQLQLFNIKIFFFFSASAIFQKFSITQCEQHNLYVYTELFRFFT